MKLTDILNEINWQQIEGPANLSDHAIFEAAVGRLKNMAVGIERYLPSCDALIHQQGMSAEAASVCLFLRGSGSSLRADGESETFVEGMRIAVNTMWMRSRLPVNMSEVYWEAVVSRDPDGDVDAKLFVRAAAEKWDVTLAGNINDWEMKAEKLDVEPTIPERVGLILLTDLLRGKDQIVEDLRHDGIKPSEYVLASSHGIQMGCALMWARDFFNRQLASPDKTGGG